MARKIQSVVRTLARVGVIEAAGRSYLVKLAKGDQSLVQTPRGEAALSRDLAAKYGSRRVLLIFADDYHSERTRSGNRVELSPMGRYLLDQK